MDGEVAIAVVAATSPGVHGETETALDWAWSFVAALMPVLLPSHEVVGDCELFAVGLGARACNVEISADELQWVEVHLGGQVFDCTHGDDRRLRMIGRTPGAGTSLIGGDGRVLLALVGNFEDVWQGRSSAAAHAAGPPGTRIPRDDLAFFGRGNLHAGVGRGTHACHLELGTAVEHVLQ